MSHSPKFTVTLSAAVNAQGSISVEALAAAAHSHGHRTLARLFGRMQARAREQDTRLCCAESQWYEMRPQHRVLGHSSTPTG